MLSAELQEIRERWTKGRWPYRDIGQALNDIEALLDHIEAMEAELEAIKQRGPA